MSTIGILPIRKTSYLFIDGGYFRKIIESFDNIFLKIFGEKGDLDYKYIKSIHQKAFYYDCPLGEKIGFDNIKTTRGFHVYEGITRGEEEKKRQKRIDILIAVHALEHAINRNMQELTFVAGDDDFVPLIESLERLGIYITLIYDEKSVSKDLISAVDDARGINLYDVYQWKNDIFKNKFKMPCRFGYIPPEISKYQKIEDGKYCGKKITLYCNLNKNYLLLWEDIKSNTSGTEHSDKNVLLKIFEETEGEIIWNNQNYTTETPCFEEPKNP